jgi:hypothetical protein
VLYLAPLNAHTRAITEALIARAPEATSLHEFTVELRPGKQSFADADVEAERLAHGNCTTAGHHADGSVFVRHECFH